jgi:hypothetical protein
MTWPTQEREAGFAFFAIHMRIFDMILPFTRSLLPVRHIAGFDTGNPYTVYSAVNL